MQIFTIKKTLIIFGALFLFLIFPYISAVLPFIHHLSMPSIIANIVFPGSITLILIPILLKNGALFFYPGLFLIFSCFFDKKNYVHFFIALVSILMVLDIIWIILSWHGAIKSQKINFLIAIIVENGLCFSFLYFLIASYYKWKTWFLLYFSALFLCLTLIYIAFPWLGESI